MRVESLPEHTDNITLQKLRRGKPLTTLDLDSFLRVCFEAGLGDRAQINKAAELSNGVGRFIRSLVGLECSAVVEAFSEFVSAGTATASNRVRRAVIEHLSHKGVMDPRLLYESPFTDVASSGPEQVFDFERTKRLVELSGR